MGQTLKPISSLVVKKELIWRGRKFEKQWILTWFPVQIFQGHPYAQFIDVETNLVMESPGFSPGKRHFKRKKNVKYLGFVYDPFLKDGVSCEDFMNEITKLNNETN